MYVWKCTDWPQWRHDPTAIADLLSAVRVKHSRLIGRMEGVGLALHSQARLQVATEEVLRTSEIEGEHLNKEAVRSSLARKLGMDIGALAPSDRHADGVVEMVLDATVRFQDPLTKERLMGWHAALFPTGYSGTSKILTGAWRDDRSGPMQVVSGELGRERVHYEAPSADCLDEEMGKFLEWIDEESELDPIVKAGRAHLWFECIHPFEDGNGRIGRAISDLLLARAEGIPQRYFSLSAQIQKERREYYSMLEKASRGSLDDTEWLRWFLGCLERSIDGAGVIISDILSKASFWARWAGTPLNARQVQMLNRLLDGFEGKMTSSKWAKIAKCSPDTALRDINQLCQISMLRREEAGGRSTSYSLNS